MKTNAVSEMPALFVALTGAERGLPFAAAAGEAPSDGAQEFAALVLEACKDPGTDRAEKAAAEAAMQDTAPLLAALPAPPPWRAVTAEVPSEDIFAAAQTKIASDQIGNVTHRPGGGALAFGHIADSGLNETEPAESEERIVSDTALKRGEGTFGAPLLAAPPQQGADPFPLLLDAATFVTAVADPAQTPPADNSRKRPDAPKTPSRLAPSSVEGKKPEFFPVLGQTTVRNAADVALAVATLGDTNLAAPVKGSSVAQTTTAMAPKEAVPGLPRLGERRIADGPSSPPTAVAVDTSRLPDVVVEPGETPNRTVIVAAASQRPVHQSLAEARLMAALDSAPLADAGPKPTGTGLKTEAGALKGPSGASPPSVTPEAAKPTVSDFSAPAPVHENGHADVAARPGSAEAPSASHAAGTMPSEAAPAAPKETTTGVGLSTETLAPMTLLRTDPLGPLASESAQSGGAHAARPATPHAIAHQLAQALPSTPDQPIELTLSPEELGKVRMTLHSSDGTITVAVHAERPETLDLMRRNIDSLARDFREMGYSSIQFDFGQHAGQRQEQNQPPPEGVGLGAPPDAPVPRRDIATLTRASAPPTETGGLDLRM